MKILVISYACFRQINRSVYRVMKRTYKDIHLIVPRHILISSGKELTVEPALEGEPHLVPMELKGKNPRTYFYPDLPLWLEANQPDIIILENDPVSKIAFVVTKWCKKNNRVVIAQSYENLKRDLLSTMRSKRIQAVPVNLVIHAMNYFMAKRIDGLFVVNKESEVIFNDYGYKNVTRIPLGFDDNVFRLDELSRQEYRTKLGLKNDVVLIAYFGRLVRQKGVHLLLEALNEIKELNWKLLIDSHHDNEDEYTIQVLELISKFGMIDRVLYFEANHFEIAKYMRAADIMVAPSITTPRFKEQYGRAVQEAMACGCIPLVSDSGHLKDLVETQSLVFKESDITTLRSKLVNLIQDSETRTGLRDSLSHRASTYLTVNAQAREVSRLIKNINSPTK
ncbi:MAG: glycosyltransferase family 4 protein [Bacteroidetes bacterium]|nr:glycosyltransferase family 4 protein [Bacteroidota bacterium]